MIPQLLRHVTSSARDADVIFRHTIYPPSLVVIALIFSVLRRGGGGGAEFFLLLVFEANVYRTSYFFINSV